MRGDGLVNTFRASVVRVLLPHIILSEVSKQPLHGYALMRLIAKRFGVCFGASTVYPCLNDLEKQGLIKASWEFNGDKPRKVYTITGEGLRLLRRTSQELSQINMVVEVKTSQ